MELGEIIANADETRRRAREAKRTQERAELERMEVLAAPASEMDEAAAVLVRAHLIAGGYHQHKGEWRRGRNT